MAAMIADIIYSETKAEQLQPLVVGRSYVQDLQVAGRGKFKSMLPF